VRHLGWTPLTEAPVRTTLTTVLDVVIGAVTFSGSLIAGGKLAGNIPGQPIVFPGTRLLSVLMALVAVGGGVAVTAGSGGMPLLLVVCAAALVFGVLMTLPIGGADMPVVISLLNAFTGTAVAMAGFVLDSSPLIIAGALVGAAGTILTLLMAEAMNRSILNIMLGGFGTGDSATISGIAVIFTARAAYPPIGAETAITIRIEA
jgi:NAD(P) transhydrogenase subunit beta